MPISNPVLINGFSIQGNDTNETSTLAVVEAACKKILRNNSFGLLYNTIVAQNIQMIAGVGTAIYSMPVKMTYGTDWNEETGAANQDLRVKRGIVALDQQITFKYNAPKGDLKRLSVALATGELDIADAILQETASSLTISGVMTMEATLLRGMINYCIAGSETRSTVLPLDFTKVVDEPTAIDAFYTINDFMIDKIRTINESEIGTNRDDWLIAFDMKQFAKLTRAYTKFLGTNISPETLATGNLYRSEILGTKVAEHGLLGQNLAKGVVNKDVAFDLSGVSAVAFHKDAVAMPMMWEETAANINYNTNQLVFTGRMWFALPSVIRPNLVFVIMPAKPTADQITAAKALRKVAATTDPNKSLQSAYQVMDYDMDGFLPTPPPSQNTNQGK